MRTTGRVAVAVALLVVVFAIANGVRHQRLAQVAPPPAKHAGDEAGANARHACAVEATHGGRVQDGSRHHARELPRRTLGVAAEVRVRAAGQGIHDAREAAVGRRGRHAHRSQRRLVDERSGDDRDQPRPGGAGDHRRARTRRRAALRRRGRPAQGAAGARDADGRRDGGRVRRNSLRAHAAPWPNRRNRGFGAFFHGNSHDFAARRHPVAARWHQSGRAQSAHAGARCAVGARVRDRAEPVRDGPAIPVSQQPGDVLRRDGAFGVDRTCAVAGVRRFPAGDPCDRNRAAHACARDLRAVSHGRLETRHRIFVADVGRLRDRLRAHRVGRRPGRPPDLCGPPCGLFVRRAADADGNACRRGSCVPAPSPPCAGC